MISRRTSISNRLLGTALGLTVVACQGSNLTLPADGSPSTLKAVSGDGQQGTVGALLPEPLVVRVTDGAARPVAQLSLQFQTDVPAAEVDPAIIATNDSGYASVRVRLGTVEGIQTVEALLASDAASGLRTTFSFTAQARKPSDDGAGPGGNDGEGDGENGHDDGHGHEHGRGGHGGDD
jgi:hypothetical protein